MTCARIRTWLPLTVVALLLLSGCAAGDDPAAAPSPAAELDLTDADVAFLQGMIPHHAQAVAMAEMVVDRTDRPELQQLADDIIASQEQEIRTMTEWLTAAGEDVPDRAAHSGMDGDMGMSGMMGEEEMSELMTAQGQEFDLLFTQMMIRHHQGAVDAAQTVLEADGNPQVAALASDIIAAQQREIEQMSAWQEEWSA